MNKTIKAINERVSLRRYDEKDVSKEHKEIIFNSAFKAPTAGNMMMYSIIEIADQDKKEKLALSCDNQPFIAKAPLVLIFIADMRKWYDYIDICDGKEFCEKQDIDYTAPDKAQFMLAVNDAIIAAQNTVVAAESMGIGSCYIGDVMENYEYHKELLNLPEGTFPAAMLCYGYYPKEYKRNYRERFKGEYVVFKDSYRKLEESELKEMFRPSEEKFVNKPEGVENIGQRMYKRKLGSDFMRNMNDSVEGWMKEWHGEKL